jgi:hypothetical protein
MEREENLGGHPANGVPEVDEGKQGKHIEGHNNYTEGKSVLTADPKELASKAGSGKPVNNVPRGQPGFKERVDFGRQIGYYVDSTGHRVPTSIGIIHYAADGIHIVPAKP